MKLYDEPAQWWPLFSAPADYAEEAELLARVLAEASIRARLVPNVAVRCVGGQ